MPRIPILFACLILLAGCTTSVDTGVGTDAGTTATETAAMNESSPFSSDYQINSMRGCGPMCEQVNITVEVMYTGDKDEIRFPKISMSVYVVDEKSDIWFFEREDEQKRIWSDSESVDNIAAGETVAFNRSFEIGVNDGIKIIYNGNCIVHGDVAVDYSGESWNKTKKFQVERKRCEN